MSSYSSMRPNQLINRTAYALRAPAAGYRTRWALILRATIFLLCFIGEAAANDLSNAMHLEKSENGESHFVGTAKDKGTFGYFEDGQLYFTSLVSGRRFGITDQGKVILGLGLKKAIAAIDLKKFCGVSVVAVSEFSGLTVGDGPSPWQTTNVVRIISHGKLHFVRCGPNNAFNPDALKRAG